MTKRTFFSLLIASTMIVPVVSTFSTTANAQQIISRQHIIKGLLVKKPRVRKTIRKTAPVINNGQVRVQKRVVRRRAPTNQLRAPTNNNGQVAVRRAPQKQFRAPGNNNNNNGQVAVRRAPQSSNGVQQLRVPKRVVRRRAPTNNNQILRAPRNNNQVVVKRRAPNRNPVRFNKVVASNNNANIQRAIRLEKRVAAYNAQAASVDLEILFDYNSARINPESVRQLFVLGEALQDQSLGNSRILIAGHTDAAGTNSYNANLSYLRAQSVSDFLVNYAGVPADRLSIEGYGEELLKYPDAPNSGQNRRVEIINLDQ